MGFQVRVEFQIGPSKQVDASLVDQLAVLPGVKTANISDMRGNKVHVRYHGTIPPGELAPPLETLTADALSVVSQNGYTLIAIVAGEFLNVRT